MIEGNKPAAEASARVDEAQDDIARTDAPPKVSLNLPLLELQPTAGPGAADQYRLEELLRYHDRAFIEHAYAALARRAPNEAEAKHTLDDLRNGRRSKIEIIEALLGAQAGAQQPIHVVGMPSPLFRNLSRWPVVGYLLRLLRGLARLPVLMQHQQQFELYALAQQQRIADYVNDVVTPAINQDGGSPANLSATLADAVEGVMMLSDSLVELSTRHAELQARLEQTQTQQQRAEAQLHADLLALTSALTAQQQQLDDVRRAQDTAIMSQQEFLVQEQRVIVETQKVAIGELQTQLRELSEQRIQQHAVLAAEVQRLRALVATEREPTGSEREQA